MVQQSFDRTQDADLLLKDAGLIAADDICQVGGSDKIVDVGAAHFQGDLVIDVTACEIDSANEVYRVTLQGSTSATFASVVVPLQTIQFGATSGTVLGTSLGYDKDVTTGRYILPVHNFGYTTAGDAGTGTYFRYLRLVVDVGGTIATGINFTAWLSKRQ